MAEHASKDPAAAADGAGSPEKKVVRYRSEEDVRKLLANDNFKKFCKKKCGHCGAVAFKRFSKISPLIVRAQIGSFWCQSCGRLLCEAHRNQHTCETEDAEFERKRRMDVGAIRDEIKRQEDAKDAAREAEAAEKRLLNEKKAAVWLAWKERRKHVAGISTSVANMVQRWAVQTDEGRVRDSLLELYTSSSRINLRLWNEVQAPEIRENVDVDAWARLSRNYARACDLTGLVVMVEGVPLDFALPWMPLEEQPWLEPEDPDTAPPSPDAT
mmetsp:Transcript_34958/g.105313  ORF Transcript_34958/g.105313 Transcript_34958/m.105313 type:complete len:270 (-) Transcript_34958:37-846(-)